MRTLTESLLAAQKAATGDPTVKVELKPRLGAVRKLSWTRLYGGTEEPYYHASTPPGDGSLIRALIRNMAPYAIYRNRVADPNAEIPGFDSWTYIADASYAGCALASYGANVILIWAAADQRTIRYLTSADYGVTWSATQTLASMSNAVYHIAAAMNADGDVLLIFFEWDTVHYYLRPSGEGWGSKQTMPDTPWIVSGISASYYAEKWAVALTGRNTTNQRCVWARELSSGSWSALSPVLISDNTALDYRAPSLAYDGTCHRLSFVEQSSSDVEYYRVYLTFHIPQAEGTDSWSPYSFADNLWKEPYPYFTNGVTDLFYGLALSCSEDFAYLTDPRAVYQASLDPTAVDLTARVLSLKQTIHPPGDGNNALVLTLDNTDGSLTPLMDTDVEISVSPGYAGEYSEHHPSAWVSAFELVSSPSESRIVIYGQGPEALLARQVFRLQTIWVQGEASVLTLIAWVIARAGLALAIDDSAPISNDFEPAFTIRAGDNALAVLKRLLGMTTDVLYQRGPSLVLTTPPQPYVPVFSPQICRPTSDVWSTGSYLYVPSSPVNKWSKVDEEVADDDTSYVRMTSGGYQWLYLGIPGFSVPDEACDITVTVYVRAKKTGMNTGKIYPGVSDGIYPTLAVAWGEAVWVPSTLWNTFVFPLPQNQIGPFQDWTPAAVNALSMVMVQQQCNTGGHGFTQMYVEVTATLPPGEPQPYVCQLPTTPAVHNLFGGKYRTTTDDINWAQVWATVTPWLTYDEFIEQVNSQYDRLETIADLNANTEDLITARAQALIDRPRRFRAEGEALIPTHCGLDLWDRVQLIDARVSIDKVFRAIGCVFTYTPKVKGYQMQLTLGPDATTYAEEGEIGG